MSDLPEAMEHCHFTTSILKFLISHSYSHDGATISVDPKTANLPEAAKYRLVTPLLTSPQDYMKDTMEDSSFDALLLRYQVSPALESLSLIGPYSFAAAVYLAAKHVDDHDFTDETPVNPVDQDFSSFLTHLAQADEPLKSYANLLISTPRKAVESDALFECVRRYLNINIVISLPADDELVYPVAAPDYRSAYGAGFTSDQLRTIMVQSLTIYREQVGHRSRYVISKPPFNNDQYDCLIDGLSLLFAQKLSTLQVPIYPVFPITNVSTKDGLTIISKLTTQSRDSLEQDYVQMVQTDDPVESDIFDSTTLNQISYGADTMDGVIDILSPTISVRLGNGSKLLHLLYSPDYSAFHLVPNGYSHIPVPVRFLTENKPTKQSASQAGALPRSLVPVVSHTAILNAPHNSPLISTRYIRVSNIS
jgi:hypothetical protein